MGRQRADGWWYPWIFVAGMLVVIAVNVVLVMYAIGTFPGLDTEDAYQKGIAYNETLAASRAQEARGWRVNVQFSPKPAMSPDAAGAVHRGELVVTLLDNAGEPLRGLDVTAALVRPTNSGFDTKLALEPQGLGEYRAEAALPLPGQWDVRVSARHGEDSFFATRRIIVR